MIPFGVKSLPSKTFLTIAGEAPEIKATSLVSADTGTLPSLPFTFQKFGLNNASDYTVSFEPIQNIAFTKTSVNILNPSLLNQYKDEHHIFQNQGRISTL